MPKYKNMDVNEIKEIALEAEKNGEDVWKMLASTTEELGELASAINVEEGRKKKVLTEPAYVEAVDLIICAVSMYVLCNGDIEELPHIIKVKLDKWKRSL